MPISYRKSAGLLLFLGGSQWVLANIIAEALYPGYSISLNYISDLGVGPSAYVFNTTMAISGLMTLAAAYCIYRALKFKFFSAALAITGIGALGVGIFNESLVVPHSVFALAVFIFSAISAFAARRFLKKPFAYLSILVGAVILLAFFLFIGQVFWGLGVGGMERMIVYPGILWMVGVGGYFMADTD
jgi:hypothetical membrane protein